MPLSIVAEVLEDIAHGGASEPRKLMRASGLLHARYRAIMVEGSPAEGQMFQALGLLNHASAGALPCLTERGKRRALRLAADIRRMDRRDARPGESVHLPVARPGDRMPCPPAGLD